MCMRSNVAGRALGISVGEKKWRAMRSVKTDAGCDLDWAPERVTVNKPTFLVNHSAASLALLLFRGFPSAFFSTGARNLPV